jgi:hypothetical protein
MADIRIASPASVAPPSANRLGTQLIARGTVTAGMAAQSGKSHGVQYAEAFHCVGGDAGRSAAEDYIKKNAVPLK